MSKEKQQITPRIDIELYETLKIECFKRRTTIDEFVSKAIKEKLNKEK